MNDAWDVVSPVLLIILVVSIPVSQAFCRICNHWGHSECYYDCKKCKLKDVKFLKVEPKDFEKIDYTFKGFDAGQEYSEGRGCGCRNEGEPHDLHTY